MEKVSDPIQTLPTEIIELILKLVDPDDLGHIMQLSKSWGGLLQNNDLLWKYFCSSFDKDDVNSDLVDGYSWREIFLRNYGQAGGLRRWIGGKYASIRCYEDIPKNFYCKFSLDTWGYILDVEAAR